MAVISFKHNFIFLKTSKTAGTSIEIELSKIAGDDAVVTPIFPAVKGHEPRNYADKDGRTRFFNHMPAKAIRQEIGHEPFSGMFKFCVEREPVSKCISSYHMMRNSSLHNPDGAYQDSWDEYCAASKFPDNLGTYAEYTKDGWQVLVDRILRYEDLPGNLTQLMAAQNIPDFQLQARAKSEYSSPVHIAPQDVTPAQKEHIYKAFADCRAATGLYKQMH